MGFLRKRVIALLVLGLAACVAMALASMGLSDYRPVTFRVATKIGQDAQLEADGGKLGYALHGDEGGAELKIGDTVQLQCRTLRDELRCSRDTFGARMAKIGGAATGIVVLLGLALSPEIRDRWGSSGEREAPSRGRDSEEAASGGEASREEGPRPKRTKRSSTRTKTRTPKQEPP